MDTSNGDGEDAWTPTRWDVLDWEGGSRQWFEID